MQDITTIEVSPERQREAAFQNLVILANVLGEDSAFLFVPNTGSALIEVDSQVFLALAWMLPYFLERHEEYFKKASYFDVVANTQHLLNENLFQLEKDTLESVRIRRNIFWVYSTALLDLYLKDIVINHDPFINEREKILYQKLFRDIISLLPEGWAESCKNTDGTQPTALRLTFSNPDKDMSGERRILH